MNTITINTSILLLLFLSIICPINIVTSTETRNITGTVVDSQGEPVEGAKVYAWNISETQFVTQSNASGHFTLKYPDNIPLRYLLAIKPGFAFDYCFTDETPGTLEIHEYGPRGNPKARKINDGPFSLVLAPDRKLKIRTLAPEGNPVTGIRVSPSPSNDEYGGKSIFHRDKSFDKPGQKNDLPLPPIPEFVKTSDADGWCHFDWWPGWQTEYVLFYANDTTSPEPRFLPKEIHYKPRTQRKEVVDEAFMVLDRSAHVSGAVRLPDDTPVVGCTIKASTYGPYGRQIQSETKTDEQGNYRIAVLPGSSLQMLVVTKPIKGQYWAAPPQFELKPEEKGLTDIDFTLEKAGRIRLRLVAKNDPTPLTNDFLNWWIMKHEEAGAEIRNSTYYTGFDTNGTLEYILPPAKYSAIAHFQRFSPKREFELKAGDNLEIDIPLENYAPEKHREVTLRTVMDDTGDFPVPFSNVKIRFGNYVLDESEKSSRKTDENGKLQITARNRDFYVRAMTPDEKFGCVRKIKPDESDVLLVLEPTATLNIRLLDTENRPLAKHSLHYSICSIEVDGGNAYGGNNSFTEYFFTDDEGKATVTLIPGHKYECLYGLLNRDTTKKEYSNVFMYLFGDWKPAPGEKRDIEEKINPIVSPDNEYSTIYSDYYDYSGYSPLEQRFWTFISECRIDEKTPVVLFSSAYSGPKLRKKHALFFRGVYDDPELDTIFKKIYLFGADTDTTPWEDGTVPMIETRPFAVRHGVNEKNIEEPLLCIFDYAGNCVTMKKFEKFYSVKTDAKTQEETVEINKPVLVEFLNTLQKQ